MPIYEYVCEQDGERLELLRPMAEADTPVPDPIGLGRTFKRVQSTFSAKGSSGTAQGGSLPMSGGCACGKPHGCGSK